jgi:hypothetical protein
VFHSATLALRSKTRDRQRFPLVYAENKSYGFERNLLGIRPEGLLMSAVACVTLGLAVLIELVLRTPLQLTPLCVALGATCLLAGFWTWWPTPARVRSAGDRYAEQLIDAAADID